MRKNEKKRGTKDGGSCMQEVLKVLPAGTEIRLTVVSMVFFSAAEKNTMLQCSRQSDVV